MKEKNKRDSTTEKKCTEKKRTGKNASHQDNVLEFETNEIVSSLQ